MRLWSGRFEEDADQAVVQFTTSLPFDKRLYRQDIQGSIAHAQMLARCGIINATEGKKIVRGLKGILRDFETGRLSLESDDEDIHSLIERTLTTRIGPSGGKLHTARSRNDQVALDLRLYAKEAISSLANCVLGLQQSLVFQAGQHIETVLPGYTHLQHAQPVTLGHHLMAYFAMLERDFERLVDSCKRVDIMPLGAGALAGTSFPIDRAYVAEQLKFSRVSENSMDSVSDRDFVVELVSILALLMVHLSRLCEEWILWSSSEFAFIELSDRYCTGSSIMPQKKNPDVLEIIRGKAGRVQGDLVSLLTMLKGLPLTYNRDLQEDKEAFFDAIDTSHASLTILANLVTSTQFRLEAMRKAVESRDLLLATDLADYLAKKGMPFRQAHEQVAHLVQRVLKTGTSLQTQLKIELDKGSSLWDRDALALLEPSASAASRTSEGGTAPSRVRQNLHRAKRVLIREKKQIMAMSHG